MTKMSDKQLQILYYGLAMKYDELVKTLPQATPQQKFDHLSSFIRRSITSPLRQLYGLSPGEQQKAYTVLLAFLDAKLQGEAVAANQPPPSYDYYTNRSGFQPAIEVRHYHYHHHYASDLLLATAAIDVLSRRRYYSGYCGYYGGGVYAASTVFSNAHAHPSTGLNRGSRYKEESQRQAMAGLLLLVLALSGVILTGFAVRYLWRQLVRNGGRFCYNEGWLRASISTLGAVAGGMAGTLLTNTLLAAPLFSLAITAGVSPVGVLIIATVYVTLIVAALSQMLTNFVQNKVIKSMNQDSLDTEEPYLFRLTASEEKYLTNRGIDPVKVKCAIVAIREHMGDPTTRGLWDRFFDNRTKAYQQGLDVIRRLRNGSYADYQNVTVAGMAEIFNCMRDNRAAELLLLEAQAAAPAEVAAATNPHQPAPPVVIYPSDDHDGPPPSYAETMEAMRRREEAMRLEAANSFLPSAPPSDPASSYWGNGR